MSFVEPEHIAPLRDSLRRFVEKEMPRAEVKKWDKNDHFPRDVFQRLAALGMMGLTVPEEFGGTGRDIYATMVVIEELSKRSMALAVPYIMSACYAGMNLVECASEEQKRRLLPLVAEGSLIFAYGWTEPDVGADIASVQTRVERAGDKLLVNGAKRFCTGAQLSDYIYALVRSGPAQERHRNLSIVLIPSKAQGVTITPMDAMGFKGVTTNDVTFDGVEVPVENLIGGESGWNHGWEMITGSGLDVEKLELAAIGVGIAQAALDDAWEYAELRGQFGKKISSYQSIRHKLADMKTRVHASRLMLYQAAWLSDNHQPCSVETSMAKLFCTEAAKFVALEAQSIMGAYGYVTDFDVERYVRDSLLLPIGGGSSAIQRNNIFRAGR